MKITCKYFLLLAMSIIALLSNDELYANQRRQREARRKARMALEQKRAAKRLERITPVATTKTAAPADDLPLWMEVLSYEDQPSVAEPEKEAIAVDETSITIPLGDGIYRLQNLEFKNPGDRGEVYWVCELAAANNPEQPFVGLKITTKETGIGFCPSASFSRPNELHYHDRMIPIALSAAKGTSLQTAEFKEWFQQNNLPLGAVYFNGSNHYPRCTQSPACFAALLASFQEVIIQLNDAVRPQLELVIQEREALGRRQQIALQTQRMDPDVEDFLMCCAIAPDFARNPNVRGVLKLVLADLADSDSSDSADS